MDEQLRSHLDELEAAIAASRADGRIDDAEREQLRALVERVRTDLGDDGDRGGLAEQLEESAVRFESDHPTIAAAIRSAVHTLTGYGI
ncbi:MAG TPA: DUF4404 family protein [Acidimicrobiales bacterium]|nr:DUF4404 family protein [Acidimicrobiales bacterium]